MSKFPIKAFEGLTYTFEHLHPRSLSVALHPPAGEVTARIHVSFGIHCFTEEFNSAMHGDHHRYSHEGELRAFNVERFQCSLQLPAIVDALTAGKVYYAGASYTYVAHIEVPPGSGAQNYSLFFNLEKHADSTFEAPVANMFIKSAYLRGLAAAQNGASWRFPALVGLNTGVYVPAVKPKPQKKGAKAKSRTP